MIKLYLEPEFSGDDQGDGGVRRVITALRRHLPAHGVELVDSPQEADVCNVHIMMAASTRRFLQQHPNIPLIASSHGLYWAEYDWGADWYQKANQECMEAIRLADVVTAPSEWVAQALRRNSLRRVAVIGHGLDLEEWPERMTKGATKVAQPDSPDATNGATFPTVGRGYVLWNKTRVDPVCDPGPLMELARRAPDVQFVTTIGDDSLPNVTVTGVLPYEEAKELVRHAGVYLCTPRETFGIGTLEAMVCGVPVLGWRWGGQTEIVEHDRTGWLAQPHDYDGLLEGLRYCLQHGRRLGRAGRRVVEKRYQWANVISAYSQLYLQLLEESQVERPKVSIVVPAYGLAEYLPETLDSVAQQTGDWECIVVDDASPDECGAIADSYAERDKRFRVLHNEENLYLAGALNAGIAEAQGRYLLPLDADNLLPPRTVERLAAALDADRSIDIAYGNVEFLNADGSRWHSGWPPPFRPEWQIGRGDGDRPPNLVPSTAAYRRRVWELTGGYRRRYRTAEDADFWTRATSYGFRARMVTDADTFVYRNRPESMSRNEPIRDWSAWYPWSRDRGAPPAAIAFDPQVPVPSLEPLLISVVIPVGPGHEELVIDALDSVDAQTLRLWECIVVNDTGRRLRYVPNWARLLETRGGLGVAAARNLAISAARSKLFVPLDADDTLEPEALSQMFEAYKRFGGYIYPDWLERWPDRMQVWNTPEYSAQELLTRGCLHAITGLYGVESWKKVGGFDETLSAWEDWDFQLRLAQNGICGTRLPVPLFTYRKETGMRRESNYAAFEESKADILERWKDYFTGKEQLMGCRSCPGGGGGRIPAPPTVASSQAAQAVPLQDREDYAVVEYIGARQGLMTFRAPSGQLYHFSASPTERQKYVRKDDGLYFANMQDFRLRERAAPAGVV